MNIPFLPFISLSYIIIHCHLTAIDGQSAMRIMQIAKKLKQSLWIILALPSLRQAVDPDREEVGAITRDIRNSFEAIEKKIEY